MQEQLSSWALGSQHLKFATTAVFASGSSSYHAVVQSSVSSSGTQTLLTWPATSTSGSLEQLAKQHTLTGSVHSLHPAPAQSTLNTQAQEGDSSSSVTVVYSDGNVAFDVEDSKGLPARLAGCRVLSATADGSSLAVVCTVKGTGSPQLELYDLLVHSAVQCVHALTDYVESCCHPVAKGRACGGMNLEHRHALVHINLQMQQTRFHSYTSQLLPCREASQWGLTSYHSQQTLPG